MYPNSSMYFFPNHHNTHFFLFFRITHELLISSPLFVNTCIFAPCFNFGLSKIFCIRLVTYFMSFTYRSFFFFRIKSITRSHHVHMVALFVIYNLYRFMYLLYNFKIYSMSWYFLRVYFLVGIEYQLEFWNRYRIIYSDCCLKNRFPIVKWLLMNILKPEEYTWW